MIGFYGGTFDPIHFGHINLAIELMEAHNLTEVWFCPALISPHRQQENPVPISHRIKMLQLALSNVPYFRVLDIESKRQPPSYTIDTIIQLQESQPQPLCLLLGEDSIPGFFHWHRVEEIVERVPLLIGKRQSVEFLLPPNANPIVSSAIERGLTPTNMFDISATEVRERLRKGLYCGHLLPEKVIDYISTNALY